MNIDPTDETRLSETDATEPMAAEPVGSEPARPIFQPLRVWPAVFALSGMVATRYVPRLIDNETMLLVLVMVLGPVLFSLGILIWWLGFSRATIRERLLGLVGILIAAGLTVVVADKTMRGPAMIMIMVPMGFAAFAIGAILFRKMLARNRTWFAVLLATIGFGFTALLQSSGMWGSGRIDWQWRWKSTAEQRMLASREAADGTQVAAAQLADFDKWMVDPQWPRFRGADAISQQQGAEISLDWANDPPTEMWRIPVGPGWASFAVAGNLLFTQEQHGDDEAVVCYLADSGQIVWTHQIKSRFSDPLGGPGPRATPTLSGGRLFAQGANGQLQRLDPRTGDLVWQQDIREVANRKPPMWGFASSPLVIGQSVIAYAGGSDDKGVLAFDVDSGKLKWSAASGNDSYSSPQLATLAGHRVVLMLTNDGLNVLDPETGDSLLDHDWPHQGYRAIQPRVIDGDSVLISTQELGTQRIRITKSDDGSLVAEEVWTSRALKPDFNDFVVYEDHLFGFDGTMFTCVDAKTGDRKWKRGRYGKGQVLLLAESGTLLVQAESGEVLLVDANPEKHEEMATLDALETRTWNHPVVIDDRLYVRNSTEAVCYRLSLVKSKAKESEKPTEIDALK